MIDYYLLHIRKNMYLCSVKVTIKIMPKIYEYFGFIFYFYSNEHEPVTQ
jgi:hypothetical protein